MAEITVTAEQDHELLELLTEWMTYWHEQDHMPAKMPAALHVRTAVALTTRGRPVPGTGPT